MSEPGCCHLEKRNGVIVVTSADPVIEVSEEVLRSFGLKGGQGLLFGDIHYRYVTQDRFQVYLFERVDSTTLPYFTTLAECR